MVSPLLLGLIIFHNTAMAILKLSVLLGHYFKDYSSNIFQVLPYFVINKLGHLKGLPGMFTACLYGAALRYLA